MDQLTNRPDAQGSINIWAMLAAVVITAVIVGGVTYYFQKTAFEAEKQQSSQNIQTLQQQISQLQTQISRLEQIKDVEKQEPVAEKQQESEDETANWETYTSNDYKYSIKFPKTLYYKGNKVQSSPGNFGAMDLIISNIKNMGVQDVMADEKIHVTITAGQKASNETLYDYIKKQGMPSNLIMEITFNNVKSYAFKTSQAFPAIAIYTANDNIVYFLHGINYLEETLNSTNFKLMQQIISTFKFTN